MSGITKSSKKALQRESPGHSLQPTLLANDADFRLLDQHNIRPNDPSDVIAAGATIIRRWLVDYVRKRKSKTRCGEQVRGKFIARFDRKQRLLFWRVGTRRYTTLGALADKRPRAAQAVEFNSFGGLTGEKIGEEIRVSFGTVKSDWRFAKAWLYRERGSDQEGSET